MRKKEVTGKVRKALYEFDTVTKFCKTDNQRYSIRISDGLAEM
jgi:hypothetical protein